MTFKAQGKPTEMGSLKLNVEKCQYPKCDKFARYFGKRKGTKHYFCTTHFKVYYNMPNF